MRISIRRDAEAKCVRWNSIERLRGALHSNQEAKQEQWSANRGRQTALNASCMVRSQLQCSASFPSSPIITISRAPPAPLFPNARPRRCVPKGRKEPSDHNAVRESRPARRNASHSWPPCQTRVSAASLAVTPFQRRQHCSAARADWCARLL